MKPRDKFTFTHKVQWNPTDHVSFSVLELQICGLKQYSKHGVKCNTSLPYRVIVYSVSLPLFILTEVFDSELEQSDNENAPNIKINLGSSPYCVATVLMPLNRNTKWNVPEFLHVGMLSCNPQNMRKNDKYSVHLNRGVRSTTNFICDHGP
jgi:hypothetical protein